MESNIKNCKGCGGPPVYQEIFTKLGPRYAILCHKCQRSSLSIADREHVVTSWNLMHGKQEEA